MTVSWTSPRAALATLGAFVATLLAACATPPPKAVEIGELPFEQAAAQATVIDTPSSGTRLRSP